MFLLPEILLDKKEQDFYAASDIHFGNRNADIKHFQRELEEAKKKNARIIIVGDVFDAIFPFGDRRYNPSLLIKELQGKDDAPLVAVEMMRDILQPYAEQIDMIGLGNHEVAVLKYQGIDMIRLLIMQLQSRLKAKHKIYYGGYQGYLFYRFKDQGRIRVLRIFYHHGAGGTAPVTKGMIDINRILQDKKYDILLFGHKHNRFTDASVCEVIPVPRIGDFGYLYTTDKRSIQIGGFLKSYGVLNKEGMPSYEEMSYSTFKPVGGTFFKVTLMRHYTHTPKERADISCVYFKIRTMV